MRYEGIARLRHEKPAFRTERVLICGHRPSLDVTHMLSRRSPRSYSTSSPPGTMPAEATERDVLADALAQVMEGKGERDRVGQIRSCGRRHRGGVYPPRLSLNEVLRAGSPRSRRTYQRVQERVCERETHQGRIQDRRHASCQLFGGTVKTPSTPSQLKARVRTAHSRDSSEACATDRGGRASRSHRSRCRPRRRGRCRRRASCRAGRARSPGCPSTARPTASQARPSTRRGVR